MVKKKKIGVLNIISSCIDFSGSNRVWVKLGKNKEAFRKNVKYIHRYVEYMQTKNTKYIF